MSPTHPILALLTGAALVLLSACGEANQPSSTSSSQSSSTSAATATVPHPATEHMQAFSDDGSVVEIVLEGNDRMQFNTESFKVSPASMVRLTLKHTGNLPAQSMGHNVVILQQGILAIDFGADVAEGGGSMENHYLPPSMLDQVIAYTRVIGGGETTAVTFKAPAEPGGYTFLCSFPGHAGLMNGAMVVE